MATFDFALTANSARLLSDNFALLTKTMYVVSVRCKCREIPTTIDGLIGVVVMNLFSVLLVFLMSIGNSIKADDLKEPVCLERTISQWKELARLNPDSSIQRRPLLDDRESAIENLGVIAWQELNWHRSSPLTSHMSARADCVAQAIVQSLIMYLQDSDPKARAAAAQSFANIGTAGRSAVPQLLQLNDDPNLTVRSRDAGALAMMDDFAEPEIPRLEKMLRDDPKSRDAAARKLFDLGAEGQKVLFKFLNDPRAQVKLAALEPLSFQGRVAVDAVDEITNLLSDVNPEVRAKAAYVLGHIKPLPAASVQKLKTLLDDPMTNARSSALNALRNTGVRLELATLTKLANDSVYYVRLTAAEMLADATGDTVPVLVKLLKDDKPAVRARAADSLKRIGPPARDAVPALKALLTDMGFIRGAPPTKVCHHAGQAIAAITGDKSVLNGLPKLERSGL